MLFTVSIGNIDIKKVAPGRFNVEVMNRSGENFQLTDVTAETIDKKLELQDHELDTVLESLDALTTPVHAIKVEPPAQPAIKVEPPAQPDYPGKLVLELGSGVDMIKLSFIELEDQQQNPIKQFYLTNQTGTRKIGHTLLRQKFEEAWVVSTDDYCRRKIDDTLLKQKLEEAWSVVSTDDN